MRRAYLALFLLALALHLCFVSIGWENPLLDRHGFRQAQTALGARTILNGSSLFEHELPVFGKPWAIPIEFPLYQAAVAAVARATPLEIDQAGRLVSAIAFYLLLPVLYAGLAIVEPDGSRRLLMLAFVLVSPLYIFWSRAVMIESTALLFAIAFVVASIRSFERPAWIAVAIVAGIVAALVKATTFAVALVPLAIYAALRRRPIAVILIAIPLACGEWWTRYADAVRARNPVAEAKTSLAYLQSWTYGTLAQRADLSQWRTMFARSAPTIAGQTLLVHWLPVTVVAAALGIAITKRYRVAALVMLAAFVAGPLVFFNVYAVHDYYFYANGIYAALFIAFGIVALGEHVRKPILVSIIAMALMLSSYILDYYYSQTVAIGIPPATAAVRRLTKSGDVIVIYGQDWNPAFPYYARRRALMGVDQRGPDDPKLQQALRNLRGERVGAVVVSGDLRDDQARLAPRLALFGCAAPPVYRDPLTDVYLPGRSVNTAWLSRSWR